MNKRQYLNVLSAALPRSSSGLSVTIYTGSHTNTLHNVIIPRYIITFSINNISYRMLLRSKNMIVNNLLQIECSFGAETE